VISAFVRSAEDRARLIEIPRVETAARSASPVFFAITDGVASFWGPRWLLVFRHRPAPPWSGWSHLSPFACPCPTASDLQRALALKTRS